jgi:hypothetical protein
VPLFDRGMVLGRGAVLVDEAAEPVVPVDRCQRALGDDAEPTCQVSRAAERG